MNQSIANINTMKSPSIVSSVNGYFFLFWWTNTKILPTSIVSANIIA
jgi:hypothetical protein